MARIVDDAAGIAQLVKGYKRVVVLGIKPESRGGEPGFYVPEYLHQEGVEIVPVPVYYPDVTRILGIPVIRKLTDVQGQVDCVDVFRKSSDIPPHVDDLIALKPKSVWFQLGIRNDDAAKRLVDAGIDVVQDKCLLVEHRKYVKNERD